MKFEKPKAMVIEEKRWYPVKPIADYLSMHEDTLRRKIEAGKFNEPKKAIKDHDYKIWGASILEYERVHSIRMAG